MPEDMTEGILQKKAYREPRGVWRQSKDKKPVVRIQGNPFQADRVAARKRRRRAPKILLCNTVGVGAEQRAAENVLTERLRCV